MLKLTVKEQKILAAIVFLLLTGLAVKSYRMTQSQSTGSEQAISEEAAGIR